MGKPSFFDNIREWVGGVSFAIYLWSVKMSKEEFWAEQDREAVEQSVQADGAICPDCHEPLVSGMCPALHALQDTPRR